MNLKIDVVHFIIEDSRLEYNLSFTDPIIAKREAIKISIIFKSINSKQEEINRLINSFDLIYSENFIFNEISKIIKAHYGNINSNLKDDKEFVCIITIPLRLKEIRPKKKNLPDKQLDSLKEFSNVLSKQTKEIILDIAKELIKIGLNNKTISQVTKLNLKDLENLEI